VLCAFSIAWDADVDDRPWIGAAYCDRHYGPPSRPAASWSGCSWFSTLWLRSLVETQT
jgi:hypothetical protein